MFLASAIALLELGVAFPALAGGQNAYAKKDSAPGLTFVAQRDGKERAANRMVVCRMPSRIRKLGPNRTFLAPPRFARVTVSECADRGGRVVRR